MTALATCSSCWKRVYGQGIPFSQLTFLIYITMYLNVDVRHVWAILQFLPKNGFTSTFKNLAMQMRKVNCKEGY